MYSGTVTAASPTVARHSTRCFVERGFFLEFGTDSGMPRAPRAPKPVSTPQSVRQRTADAEESPATPADLQRQVEDLQAELKETRRQRQCARKRLAAVQGELNDLKLTAFAEDGAVLDKNQFGKVAGRLAKYLSHCPEKQRALLSWSVPYASRARVAETSGKTSSPAIHSGRCAKSCTSCATRRLRST